MSLSTNHVSISIGIWVVFIVRLVLGDNSISLLLLEVIVEGAETLRDAYSSQDASDWVQSWIYVRFNVIVVLWSKSGIGKYIFRFCFQVKMHTAKTVPQRIQHWQNSPSFSTKKLYILTIFLLVEILTNTRWFDLPGWDLLKVKGLTILIHFQKNAHLTFCPCWCHLATQRFKWENEKNVVQLQKVSLTGNEKKK